MFDYLREHQVQLLIGMGLTIVAIVGIIFVLDAIFGILDDYPRPHKIKDDNR